MKLSLLEKLHMRHRFARYRYKSEVPDIRYVMESNLEGKTLVDIGANKGIYCYYLSRKAGSQGKVYAFEAQPELGDHLQSVKESFNLDNLHIVNKGLSSEPGILKMVRTKVGAGGASFYLQPDGLLEELDVPVITLDDFFGREVQETISFIKCDVEGYEYEVLKGGEMVLRRDNPTILLECLDKEAKAGRLFGYLADLGYSGFFYFVRREDHARYRFKDRGIYVRVTEFDKYDYVRPTIDFRNYIFTKDPDEIQKLSEYRQN